LGVGHKSGKKSVTVLGKRNAPSGYEEKRKTMREKQGYAKTLDHDSGGRPITNTHVFAHHDSAEKRECY